MIPGGHRIQDVTEGQTQESLTQLGPAQPSLFFVKNGEVQNLISGIYTGEEE